MYLEMDWQISIGDYYLMMVSSCEIHKSVDLLASTCEITLPGYAHQTAFRVEDTIGRGDKVKVKLGYNGYLKTEFEGYLLDINTDGGSLTIQCENELFLLRKSVRDKEFIQSEVKDIVQYLLDDSKVDLSLDCTLTIDYDKFVIHQATAYDVLKKLKEETKANIYLSDGVLHVHPPYSQHYDLVKYSFQQNIEKDDLKYVRKRNKRIQVVVTSTGKDGKVRSASFGTTGGDKIEKRGDGMSEKAMKEFAKTLYDLHLFDGYEGSITGWLVPVVRPGDTAEISDEDYDYKNGKYFVNAVTTSMDENGGVRKVELGKRLQ